MWLDRLAAREANSTPSPQPGNRPYSPLPRRSSSNLSPYVTSQRSGLTPRGSSLSLVSNDSTASLLGSSRKLNGSNLKHSTTLREGPAPEEVLERLIGAKSVEDEAALLHSITANDLELEFDFGGLSLKELAANRSGAGAIEVRRQPLTVQEYREQREKFEVLHKSIADCDDVLNSVETNFTSFRNDLAAVSADIETLQNRSTALSVRLENRKAVEKALGPVVEELSVSPVTVSKIVDGHLDEAWAKALGEVDKKSTAYKKDSSSPRQSKAWADLGPLLDKLVLKAIERIRDYLITQIKAMRSPNINAQIIQQQYFIRQKDAFAFLYRHHSQLGDEICQAYMNTMRWYYLNQFTRYQKALDKMKLHVLDRSEVLGHQETPRSTATSLLSASRALGPHHDAFNLGRRIDLLTTSNQAALPSYLAEENTTTHYLEVPFRNFNLALIDNASAEYTFLTNFFAPPMSLAKVSRHFNYIFEPTFALGHQLTKSLVTDTYDSLGLLLCIRLNQHYAFELQRRKVPSLDGYVNGTNMLLWPRLQVVIDHQCESVRALANSTPSKPSKGAAMSAAPHMATQRFGQLLQGILALSAEAGDDEPVVTSLRRLRSEMEAFLTKQSKVYGDKRKQERFLYTNYSLILTIISDVDGKLAVEQQQHFETLKTAFQE